MAQDIRSQRLFSRLCLRGYIMKKIYELDMDVHEDRITDQALAQAERLVLAVWDFDMYLRNTIKHGQLPDEVEAALSKARTELHEYLVYNNVTIDLE